MSILITDDSEIFLFFRQRIAALETENSNVKEQVWKLEHGRNWMENRLTAMEADLQSLKEEKEKSS